MENQIVRVPFDQIEIIELDERLDMAVDPILGVFRPDLNGVCGSACGGNSNVVCGIACGGS